MSSQGRASIQFTLDGQRYELSREGVESRLLDVAPDAIRKHAVRVNDTWFPVIQAFEVATGYGQGAGRGRRSWASTGWSSCAAARRRTRAVAGRGHELSGLVEAEVDGRRLGVGAGHFEVDALDVLIDVAGMSPDLLGPDGLAALEESHG